jgi:hypothetical protein
MGWVWRKLHNVDHKVGYHEVGLNQTIEIASVANVLQSNWNRRLANSCAASTISCSRRKRWEILLVEIL